MEELKELFLKLGYNENEYVEIVNTYPIINTRPETLVRKVKENYEFLISLGYSKEEIIKMTKNLPAIYNYSIGNIKQKIEDMEELGYSREEVIKMTIGLPSILGLSIENIKQKIEFYDFIGLHFLAVVDPKKLMQSTKLSYARYMFFKEKGIVIDKINYNKLFANQKQFEKKYGLTKDEILQKYPYEEWQASANEAEEDSKVQSDDEHEKERLVSEMLEKQGEVARLEEKISELQSKKNELE